MPVIPTSLQSALKPYRDGMAAPGLDGTVAAINPNIAVPGQPLRRPRPQAPTPVVPATAEGVEQVKQAEQPPLDTPIALEPNVDPSITTSQHIPASERHPSVIAAQKAVDEALHAGHQGSPRGALFKPIEEQGMIPPTYRPMTPWPERLFRQRHGHRELFDLKRGSHPGAYAVAGSGKTMDPTIAKLLKKYDRIPDTSAVGYGHVPELGDSTFNDSRSWGGTGLDSRGQPEEPHFRKSWLGTPWNSGGSVGYWGTKNHETEHAFQQRDELQARLIDENQNFVGPKQIFHPNGYEVGPTIGDIVFRAEQFAKEEGKPLEHTVKLPGGVQHDVNWMRRQARERGYWGASNPTVQGRGRSMTDLIFNTPEGRAWYKRMVDGEKNKLMDAPATPAIPPKLTKGSAHIKRAVAALKPLKPAAPTTPTPPTVTPPAPPAPRGPTAQTLPQTTPPVIQQGHGDPPPSPVDEALAEEASRVLDRTDTTRNKNTAPTPPENARAQQLPASKIPSYVGQALSHGGGGGLTSAEQQKSGRRPDELKAFATAPGHGEDAPVLAPLFDGTQQERQTELYDQSAALNAPPVYKSMDSLEGNIKDYYKNVPGGYEAALAKSQEAQARRVENPQGNQPVEQALDAYSTFNREDLQREITHYRVPTPAGRTTLPGNVTNPQGRVMPVPGASTFINPNSQSSEQYLLSSVPRDSTGAVTHPDSPQNIGPVPILRGVPNRKGMYTLPNGDVVPHPKGKMTIPVGNRMEVPKGKVTADHELTHEAIGGRSSSDPRFDKGNAPWAPMGKSIGSGSYHDYATTPQEMDPRLAEIKRSYSAATGKHIDSDASAEAALQWWADQGVPNSSGIPTEAFHNMRKDPIQNPVMKLRLQELLQTDPNKKLDNTSNQGLDQGMSSGTKVSADTGLEKHAVDWSKLWAGIKHHAPRIRLADSVLGSGLGALGGLGVASIRDYFGDDEKKDNARYLSHTLAGAGLGLGLGNLVGDRARRYISNNVPLVGYSAASSDFKPKSLQHVIDTAIKDKPAQERLQYDMSKDIPGDTAREAGHSFNIKTRHELMRHHLGLPVEPAGRLLRSTGRREYTPGSYGGGIAGMRDHYEYSPETMARYLNTPAFRRKQYNLAKSLTSTSPEVAAIIQQHLPNPGSRGVKSRLDLGGYKQDPFNTLLAQHALDTDVAKFDPAVGPSLTETPEALMRIKDHWDFELKPREEELLGEYVGKLIEAGPRSLQETTIPISQLKEWFRSRGQDGKMKPDDKQVDIFGDPKGVSDVVEDSDQYQHLLALIKRKILNNVLGSGDVVFDQTFKLPAAGNLNDLRHGIQPQYYGE